MAAQKRESGLRLPLTITAIGVVCIGGLLGTLFYLFNAETCVPVVRDEIPSPNRDLSAVVFEMECGATVGFNTQVSIVPPGQEFDPGEHPSFLSMRGQHSLQITWTDERRLAIAVPTLDVYRQEQPSNGVVDYE